MKRDEGEHVVRIEALSRRFGRTLALDGVSLEIPRGAVFGLVGENGSGKTTLIKHMLGLYKAQSGTVRVFGRDPVRDPVGVLGRIGYLSEDRDLPDWMTIGEIVAIPPGLLPGLGRRVHRPTCGCSSTWTPEQGSRDCRRGRRRAPCLLTAMAFRPELLVLDEPSTGLDPIVRRDILSAIIRTIADEGRTVLFSSHLLDEVERMADWVAMIDRGRIVLSGPLDEIKAAPPPADAPVRRAAEPAAAAGRLAFVRRLRARLDDGLPGSARAHRGRGSQPRRQDHRRTYPLARRDLRVSDPLSRARHGGGLSPCDHLPSPSPGKRGHGIGLGCRSRSSACCSWSSSSPRSCSGSMITPSWWPRSFRPP